jgi:hypothetical protein
LRGDLLTVRPFHRRDSKDVAEAIVAQVPALGEPGDDIPVRVEADQTLRDVLEQHGVGFGERP